MNSLSRTPTEEFEDDLVQLSSSVAACGWFSATQRLDDATASRRRFKVAPNRRVRALVWCLLSVVVTVGRVEAAEHQLSPESDMRSLLKRVTAGDTIVIASGTWKDSKLTFDSIAGTAGAPITIRAERAGKVIFTGESEFRVSGNHVVVSGLVFRDVVGVSDVFQLRTHSKRHAHDCRVTDCLFEQTRDLGKPIESRWMSIYGTRNRVDHSEFRGKSDRGATLVVWVNDEAGAHRIDHNHFGHRPELGRNGGETIRIGTSEVSEFDSRTVVEANYFHRCNGEAEIVSNKSCGNIYRHNVFDECSGALTLRHGHRCVVDSNAFLGRTQRGTGGVRIIGSDHRVSNNYFEGLRGDAERAAVCVMNGIPDSPLDGYAPVRRAMIAHNTMVDCKVTMEWCLGKGNKQSEDPADCRVVANLFAPGKWPLFRAHGEPVRCHWQDNRRIPDRPQPKSFVEIETIDLVMERGSDELLRPRSDGLIDTGAASALKHDIDDDPRGQRTAIGCDQPTKATRRWPTKRNAGPTWLEKHDVREARLD